MNVNLDNHHVHFGAIRVKTGQTEAGKIAREICHRINHEVGLKGHAIYPESNVMFFRNIADEDKAENILSKENINYTRNAIADIADTYIKQEWAQTGDSNILLDWYLKNRKF